MFRQVTQTGRVSEIALGDDGYVKAIRTREGGWAGTCWVLRSQPARRLPDQRQRARRRGVQAAGGVEAQSVDVLAGYVRRSDLFKGHAGSGFL